MDTLMDEFQDEQKFKELNEREVAAWLEVTWLRMRYLDYLACSHEFYFFLVLVVFFPIEFNYL